MNIEIWIDFTCPFCYLGKNRLFKALDRFKQHKQVQIQFRSYLLSPNDDNIEQLNGHDWLAKHKDITVDQAKALNLNVQTMAFEDGIALDFDYIIPRNTVYAHQLMQQLSGDAQIQFVHLVYEAYFQQHLDIASVDVLVKLGAQVGLTETTILSIFESSQHLDAIKADIDLSTKFGLRGVPFFVLNRKYSISGAQEELYFLDTLQELYDEIKPKKSTKTTYCVGDHCERKIKK